MAASVPSENNTTEKKSSDLDIEFLKTPVGLLRVSEGILALASIITVSESTCYGDAGQSGFTLFNAIVTLLESIFVSLLFVFKFDEKIKTIINVPLSILLMDVIALFFYFIVTTLSLMAIGRCDYSLVGRIFTSLFSIVLFMDLVGLVYFDYMKWNSTRITADDTRTTVTESSPTVLT